jgi:hypothetical protein
MKKKSFFWIGYSDLMTSLFFLMLVLFIVAYRVYEVDRKMLKEIKNVDKALKGLNNKYFEYDDINKRYRLKNDIIFDCNGCADTLKIRNYKKELPFLKEAGKSLFNAIDSIIKRNPDVDYLLIIEGNTQRYNNNWLNYPDTGYKVSYNRALTLYNFWKNNGIDFRELSPQCEIIIADSGYFGQARDLKHEWKNRRFTIQITSKVGKFLQKKEDENN